MARRADTTTPSSTIDAEPPLFLQPRSYSPLYLSLVPVELQGTMTDVYVQSFTHLKDRHRADDALKLLQKVASLVKPIMRKRGWILPILAEFFPDNPNLLGESLPSFTPTVGPQ